MRDRHTIRAVSRMLTMMMLLALPISGLGGLAPARSALAQTSQTVNVEFVLDSSGSMAEVDGSGQPRIDSAKQVLSEVIDSLPEREGINVGFRVYGHEGNNTEAGKSVSCESTDLVVPVEGVDKEALRAQVASYEPVGWTPIALSLREAGNDFPAAAPEVVNAIVLVTDGLETCGGDPCSASRQIKNGPSAITTHVIGFALAEEEQANLQCIVDESGGLLLGAGNAAELGTVFFQVLEELEVVITNGMLEIEEIGGIFPRATIDGVGEATDSNPAAEPLTLTLTDSNVVELPAGTYDVHWANPSGQESRVTIEIEADKTTVIRGSIFRFPHGAGEVYILKDTAGTVIWQDQIEAGDLVWVLPGVYRLELEELTGDAIIISLDVQTLPGSVTEVDITTAP